MSNSYQQWTCVKGRLHLNREVTVLLPILALTLLSAFPARAAPLDEARALHEEAQRILTGDRPSPDGQARAIRLLSAARSILIEPGTPEESGLLREISAALYWARKFQRTRQSVSQPAPNEQAAQEAFRRADELERSGTTSAEAIQRAYADVQDRFAGTSWAIRATMRIRTATTPVPMPETPPPDPPSPPVEGTPQLEVFTRAVHERRFDDAWEWLDRARKSAPADPVTLAAIEEDLATLDWIAVRALGSMLGRTGGTIRAIRHDGRSVEGTLRRADPFGLQIETRDGMERVGFHDLSDATLAEISAATPYERGVLALRAGNPEEASTWFKACRNPRASARLEEIRCLQAAGTPAPR